MSLVTSHNPADRHAVLQHVGDRYLRQSRLGVTLLFRRNKGGVFLAVRLMPKYSRDEVGAPCGLRRRGVACREGHGGAGQGPRQQGQADVRGLVTPKTGRLSVCWGTGLPAGRRWSPREQKALTELRRAAVDCPQSSLHARPELLPKRPAGGDRQPPCTSGRSGMKNLRCR